MSQFNPLQRTSEAHAYIEIEKFVDLVLNTSDMPFHIEENSSQLIVVPRLLSKEFHTLTRYWNHFSSDYDFEVHIQLYWDACRFVGFLDGNGVTEVGMAYDPMIHAHAYAVNDLVRFIRCEADSNRFKRSAHDRKYQASEKCCSIEVFIKEAMARYSKSLIVRVDLGYPKEHSHRVTIADMYDHIDAFLACKGSSEAFAGLVGYAVAIEQGVNRGYHAHFVAVIDGNKYCNEWHRGTLFGALWDRLIGNARGCHICMHHPELYGPKGVGHFRRDEPESHFGVVKTAQYLTEYKEDQYLRAKPRGRRVFRTFPLR